MKFRKNNTWAYESGKPQDDAFKTIKQKEFDRLVNWCKINFDTTKNINYNISTSYGLKHDYEYLENTYVTNEDFKRAMKKAGFESSDAKNENYNISKRSVNKLNKLINSNQVWTIKFKQVILKQNVREYVDKNYIPSEDIINLDKEIYDNYVSMLELYEV